MSPRRPKRTISRRNTSHYRDIVTEAGEAALLIVMHWMYVETKLPEQNLINFFKTTKEKRVLRDGEFEKLERLGREELELEDLGFTFLCALIPLTCGLKIVTENSDENEMKKNLRELLHELKEQRNTLSHVLPRELRNISFEYLQTLIENFQSLLLNIVDIAGKLGCKLFTEVHEQEEYIKMKIKEISDEWAPANGDIPAADSIVVPAQACLSGINKEASSNRFNVDMESLLAVIEADDDDDVINVD